MNAPTRSGGDLHKVLVFVIAAAALAGLAWYVKNHVSLEQLIEQENRLRDYIADKPWRAFLAGLGIYAVVSLVPGTSGKSVIFSWLFGFWRGVIMIILGLTAAAMVIFALSRYVFRERIENRYGRFLTLLNKHIRKEGAFYLLTLRMAHAPYSIINLASGASRVETWTFCWTTMVGLLPGTLVWAYVGARLPSLAELSTKGADSLLDAPLIAALVLSALLPFLIRLCVSKLGIPASRTTGPHAAPEPEPRGSDS